MTSEQTVQHQGYYIQNHSGNSGASTDVFVERAICRFCRQAHSVQRPLIVPCQCKHAHRFVHIDCMKKWIQENGLLETPYCATCSCAIHINVSVCRICHGHGHTGRSDEKGAELIAPCRCRGFLQFVHRDCLLVWTVESRATRCPDCRQAFATSRVCGPSKLSQVAFGIPAYRYDNQHFSLIFLFLIYASLTLGIIVTSVVRKIPTEVKSLLLAVFIGLSWVIVSILLVIRVFTEARFIEFTSQPGNNGPVMPPVEEGPNAIGRLAIDMPITSPLFEDRRFLQQMAQALAVSSESFFPTSQTLRGPSSSVSSARSDLPPVPESSLVTTYGTC